jgi:hypothetical protein
MQPISQSSSSVESNIVLLQIIAGELGAVLTEVLYSRASTFKGLQGCAQPVGGPCFESATVKYSK